MPHNTMTEPVTPPPKKRRWRKPSSQSTDNVNSEQECNKTAISSQSNDVLHPEVLSDADLICRLNEYHVPVACDCSRDELVELFSKHVMPKPQRKRRRGHQCQVNKYVCTAGTMALNISMVNVQVAQGVGDSNT